jgi:hypothetical protein
MIIVLYILLIALLVLEFTKYKNVRVYLVLSILLISSLAIIDIQRDVRVSGMEQEEIASIIENNINSNNWEILLKASNRYFADKNNATYEKPFNKSFYSYIREESYK